MNYLYLIYLKIKEKINIGLFQVYLLFTMYWISFQKFTVNYLNECKKRE